MIGERERERASAASGGPEAARAAADWLAAAGAARTATRSQRRFARGKPSSIHRSAFASHATGRERRRGEERGEEQPLEKESQGHATSTIFFSPSLPLAQCVPDECQTGVARCACRALLCVGCFLWPSFLPSEVTGHQDREGIDRRRIRGDQSGAFLLH